MVTHISESYVNTIVSSCSTNAGSMRCHYMWPFDIVPVSTDIEANSNELVYLPALHRKISKTEIFDNYKASVKNNILKRVAFYYVARRLTKTQDRSL